MRDLSKRKKRNSSARTKAIRILNDAFRKSLTGGVVTLTAGVEALNADTKAQLLSAVRTFKDFDKGNDPHGEHDFGAIEIGDVRVPFQIDYYDRAPTLHSDD